MANSRGPFVLVAFLWIALGINYVDRQMVYSIFPALKGDLQFSDAQLGLVGSIFSWIYSICMPIAGRMADRFRRDRMIVLSMGLWSVATLGCGLSGSVMMFLLWRAVVALTEALYYPAAVGMLAAAHGDATRSRALGIHQSAQLAGIVVGGWYGGWMADHVSWRAGFGIAGLAGVLYSAVLLKTLPVAVPPAASTPMSWKSAKALTSSPCYVMLCLAFFAFCAMLWTFYAWFPSFLYERYHLSMTESGFSATVFIQVSCGIGVLVGSTLADRLAKLTRASRFYVAAAGILISAPFGYATFATESLDMAKLCSAGYGFFSGFMVANVFASSYDVIDRGNFGLGAGVLNMMGGISAAIMIYLAGALKGTVGFAGLLQWVALACVISAIALVVVARRNLEQSSAAASV